MIAASILAAAIGTAWCARVDGAAARVVAGGELVVGKAFAVEVALDGDPPDGTAIDFPKAPLDLGALMFLTESDAGRTARRYSVVPAVSGRLEIPSLSIELRDDSGAVRSVRTAPIAVDVRSSLGAQARRFPDLVGDLQLVVPEGSSITSREVAIGIGALLVAMSLTALVAGRARLRKANRAARTGAAGPSGPSGLARLRARLDALQEALATDSDAAGAVALESAAVVREAIEISTRGTMPAPRRTSEEVSEWTASTVDSRVRALDVADFALVLAAADQLKYGGTAPDRDAAGVSIGAARRAIESLLDEPASATR